MESIKQEDAASPACRDDGGGDETDDDGGDEVGDDGDQDEDDEDVEICSLSHCLCSKCQRSPTTKPLSSAWKGQNVVLACSY